MPIQYNKNINERFPKNTGFSIVIFNVEEFPPDIDSQRFLFYGNEEIKLSMEHYETNKVLIEQWNEFRLEMLNLRKKWYSFKQQIVSNNPKLKVILTEW